MEWHEVLSYERDVRGIARKIANSVDPDLYEDAVHHAYIMMREKIDLSKATGPEKEYVRGAIWNIVMKFFQSPSEGGWNHVSIEQLTRGGFQIDNAYAVYWTGECIGDNTTDGDG